jgi:tetratricopeptide (TPR) repeat protein
MAMATFDEREQVVTSQYNADRITIYAQATPRPVEPEILAAAERQLAALPLDMIPAPAPLPAGSRMPLRQNPLFVGRQVDLRALAFALKGGEITAIGQTAAATGLGGIGKTQLAGEFVHRYGQFFAGGVFWLSFADPAAVFTEVAACGGPDALALHPDIQALPLEEQVRFVQVAWQSPLPRLLVFDNCEDEALLARWRPPHGGCRVLVTSRRAQWDAALGIRVLALDVLHREESLALLYHHRPDLSADDADLDAIAAELGDLPLALHLAGSFLARYRMAISPAAYLAQLRRPDLLVHPSLRGWKLTRELSPTRHEQHVARTFALSYDRLDPADPTDAHARALLARAAYFAPGQPMPRRLLLATVAWAGDAPDPALQAEDALRRLLELGLLESDATGTVWLHRLLAAFVRAIAHDTAAQTAVGNVLIVEAYRLHSAGHTGPVLTLQPHLQAVTEAVRLREDVHAARVETVLGHSLRLLGDYAGAQPAYERALALHERLLGPDHPDVAKSLYDLANLYRDRGRYREAELLYQRALAIQERGLGPDDSDVFVTRTILLLIYWYQGRYAEAEPLLQRALNFYEQGLGPTHSHMAVRRMVFAFSQEVRRKEAFSMPLWRRIRLFVAIIHMSYTALNQYISRGAAPSKGAMMRMAYAGVRHRIRVWLSGRQNTR